MMNAANPASGTPADSQPAAAPRDWRTPLELMFLGIVWGCSFLLMRVAAPQFGAYARWWSCAWRWGRRCCCPSCGWRARFPLRRWPTLAAIGWICNAMTLLFTALIAFLFLGEKIGARRVLALLIGFIGIVVLATGKSAGLSVGPAAFAGATASLLYGIGYSLVKRYMSICCRPCRPPPRRAAAHCCWRRWRER